MVSLERGLGLFSIWLTLARSSYAKSQSTQTLLLEEAMEMVRIGVGWEPNLGRIDGKCRS